MLSTSWKLRKVVGLRKHAENVCFSSALTANPSSKERKPTVIDPDPSEFVPIDQVRYPPIRPEFPTSKWSYGSTSQKTAWEFQLRSESLQRQPTVFDKAQQFNLFEAKENFYNIVVPFTMPNALKFSQFLTRTHVIGQDVEPGKTADKQETKANATSGFTESVFAELPENFIQLIAERAAPQIIQTVQRSAKDSNASQTVLEDVLDILVLTASASKQQITASSQGGSTAQVVEEMERAQIGRSGRMQTFWRRSGFEQVPEVDLKKIISMSEYLKYVRKRIRDEFGHARFTLQADAIWQMRSTLPTSPLFADRLFVAPDAAGGSAVDASHPFASFWNVSQQPVPRTTQPAHDPGLYFDLPQHDLHTFWHIHVQNFARLHQLPRIGRNVPAFWPRTPFWPGDPAEFPVLAAVRLDSTPFRNAYGDQRVAEIVQTNALLTAFGWCAAAAFNQGYTIYDELDYPISTFTVAFDGAQRQNMVSLCGFQLNALSALWKAADCGDPLNVASFSHAAPLFELDSTTQRVAVNQPIIKLLVAALLRGNLKARFDPSADLSPNVRQRSPVLPTFPFERTKAVEPDYAADVRNAAIDSEVATGTEESDKLPASHPDAAPTQLDKTQLRSAKTNDAATLIKLESETESNDVTYSFGTHASCIGVPSRLWRTWINVKGEAPFSRTTEPPAILKRRWTPRMHVNERYLARRSDPRDILFDVRRTYPRLQIPVRLLKIKNPEQKLNTKRFRENLESAKREVDEPYHKVVLGDWTSRGRNN